ncbi:hypothetical protein NBRC10512_004545 [Rhodotorula toruloides]|uniref:RHTO0S10e04170g1_1 n=2 Tax=Rhodotorula toruloides TaxID=5286 RepID=A0A061BAU3_RHOTO|nr:SET domain superfamily protein [Rhodotorula toruloides NP11]EMS18968.1 SET domain superfamily protein [Rhodotorula toruloides NP11]CDR45012.1 RHTO0S10e04170g1_1 [Rhodotorula toruloides]
MLKSPSALTPCLPVLPPDSPFQLVVDPDKGVKAVASRMVKAGELILTEAPLFILDDDLSEPTVAAVVSALSPDEQTVFYALANSLPEVGPHRGRVETNAFACEPIPAGVELCISYGTLLKPRIQRQALLQKKYRFVCACPACSLPPAHSLQSDLRRCTIGHIGTALSSLKHDPVALIELAKQGLALLEAEGLAIGRSRLAHRAYRAAVVAGDREASVAWAGKFLEFNAREEGIEASEYRRVQAAVDQLERDREFRRTVASELPLP